jgi:hypothetical protein
MGAVSASGHHSSSNVVDMDSYSPIPRSCSHPLSGQIFFDTECSQRLLSKRFAGAVPGDDTDRDIVGLNRFFADDVMAQ